MAEAALRLAAEQKNRWVYGGEINAAWSSLIDGQELPAAAAHKHWDRLLGFGITAGRVRLSSVDGFTCFVPNDLRHLPLPVRPERRPTPRIEQLKCELGTALRAVTARTGRPATTREIIDAFTLKHGHPPHGDTSRMVRVLQMLEREGSVRAWKPARGDHAWAPADDPGIAPGPEWSRSAMAMVEEALHRAVNRSNCPVTVPAIELELAGLLREAGTSLPASRSKASHSMQGLVSTGRVQVIPRSGPQTRKTNYYTYPGGPRQLEADQLENMDRRRLAIKRMWTATQGRPFTTAAIRRWTERNHPDWFADAPPYGWINALRTLELAGEVVAFHQNGTDLRWAPSEEWRRIPAHAQASRLEDVWRDVDDPVELLDTLPPTAGDEPVVLQARRPGAPSLDAAFRSNSRNLATLVLLAQALQGKQATDEVERAILASRPVTLSLLRTASIANPSLIPAKRDVQDFLKEATRDRNGRRELAIVRVGVVGREAYYSLPSSTGGVAFIEMMKLLHEPSRRSLKRAVAELVHDAGVPLSARAPGDVLVARARILGKRITVAQKAGESALKTVPLLPAEKAEMSCLLDELRRMHESLRDMELALPIGFPLPPGDVVAVVEASPGDDDLLDPEMGLAQIRELAPPYLVGGGIASLLGIDTTVVRVPVAARRRRQTIRFLDRVGFSMAALSRWGGPAFKVYGEMAKAAIGSLRDREALRGVVLGQGRQGDLAGVVAALGVFDDSTSRTTVVEAFRAWTQNAALKALTPAVLGAVAFALSKKPAGGLATAVSQEEREVLELIARRWLEQPAAPIAREILAIWDGAVPELRLWGL